MMTLLYSDTFSIPPLQDGRTPLHCAAQNGQSESVRLLLDRGADKEAKDEVRGKWKGDRGHVSDVPLHSSDSL